MKILFLDDDPVRLKIAKQYFIGYELHIAQTADGAIKLLKEEILFDLVYLDHDLGGNVFVPSDEKSGYEVAKYITTMINKPKKVIIHSFNPVGAKNMMSILEQEVSVERIPFNFQVMTNE